MPTISEPSTIETDLLAARGTLAPPPPVSTPRLLVQCARPHQWVKNLFVFAPLLFGQKLTDLPALGQSLLAVVSFCLTSSAIYILNDIIDAAADRSHPKKASRPVASGALSAPAAAVGSSVLMASGLVLALCVDTRFLLTVAAYVALILAYCLALKHYVLIDVMAIAGGFVLRLVGGAVAVSVIPSHWLILCAFLLSLFLALSKRRQELLSSGESGLRQRRVLAGYTTGFLDQAINIVVGAAIVCYALYTVAPETIARFGTDALVYGNIFVIYGFLRYMAYMQKAGQGEDPSKLLIRSRALIFTVVAWGAYNVVVTYRAWLQELWTQITR